MHNKTIVNFLFLIIIISISLTLSACVNNTNSKIEDTNNSFNYLKNQPTLFNEKDLPIICINNLNQEIRNESSNKGFLFNVLSKEKISIDDIQMIIDIDLKHTITEMNTQYSQNKFPYEIYLQYNSIDEIELNKNSNIIKEEYDNISEENIPKFYNNEFYVEFETPNNFDKDIILHNAKFLINDIEYTVDLGNIYFKSIEKPSKDSNKVYDDNDLSFNIDKNIKELPYNNSGLLYVNNLKLTSKKDIIITDVFVESEIDIKSIEESSFTIMSEGESNSKEYESGDKIKINAGSIIDSDFVIKDIEYAKTPIDYSTIVYLVVKYEVGGEEYEARTNVNLSSKLKSYELYSICKDDIDLTSYFDEQ